MGIKIRNYIYQTSGEEVRAEISIDQAIQKLEKVYGVKYASDIPNFDVWDQLLACEALAEATPIKESYEKEINKSASVNGMINGSCKHNATFELTQDRQQVVVKLDQCNYRTPPVEIACLLQEFFKEWQSKQGHWLYISQNWTPRTINRVINRLIKHQATGQVTINNPSAYFTFLIKHRKKRRVNKYQ